METKTSDPRIDELEKRLARLEKIVECMDIMSNANAHFTIDVDGTPTRVGPCLIWEMEDSEVEARINRFRQSMEGIW